MTFLNRVKLRRVPLVSCQIFWGTHSIQDQASTIAVQKRENKVITHKKLWAFNPIFFEVPSYMYQKISVEAYTKNIWTKDLLRLYISYQRVFLLNFQIFYKNLRKFIQKFCHFYHKKRDYTIFLSEKPQFSKNKDPHG